MGLDFVASLYQTELLYAKNNSTVILKKCKRLFGQYIDEKKILFIEKRKSVQIMQAKKS